MQNAIVDLREALRERLAIIHDEESRRDEEQHMARLRVISEKIDKLQAALPRPIDPQLAHYLQRRSYDKALEFLEGRGDWRRRVACLLANAFGASNIAWLGGCTLTPNSIDAVEKSVDNYCWQKAAAASPQFARDEPKYDRAKRHNCPRLQVDNAEQNGRERNGSRDRATEERESNHPPPLQHGLD